MRVHTLGWHLRELLVYLSLLLEAAEAGTVVTVLALAAAV
jgi:hypothetical protein